MGKTNKNKYPHSVGNLQARQVNTALIIVCVCVCVYKPMQNHCSILLMKKCSLRVTKHASEKHLYLSQHDFL